MAVAPTGNGVYIPDVRRCVIGPFVNQRCQLVLLKASPGLAAAAASCLACKHFSRIQISMTPAWLAQINWEFVLLVSQVLIALMLEQKADDFHMPTHGCPV